VADVAGKADEDALKAAFMAEQILVHMVAGHAACLGVMS
jgi:hypothetical protein